MSKYTEMDEKEKKKAGEIEKALRKMREFSRRKDKFIAALRKSQN
jgi:hypothetical protein